MILHASVRNRSPSGGVFLGGGISDSVFNPQILSPGTRYQIIYVYTNPITGCVGSDTQYVRINGKAWVNIGMASQYCIYNSPITLPVQSNRRKTERTRSFTMFTADSAGVGGPYQFIYTYTSPSTGCVNADTDHNGLR
jgi:hypothetical protein